MTFCKTSENASPLLQKKFKRAFEKIKSLIKQKNRFSDYFLPVIIKKQKHCLNSIKKKFIFEFPEKSKQIMYTLEVSDIQRRLNLINKETKQAVLKIFIRAYKKLVWFYFLGKL